MHYSLRFGYFLALAVLTAGCASPCAPAEQGPPVATQPTNPPPSFHVPAADAPTVPALPGRADSSLDDECPGGVCRAPVPRQEAPAPPFVQPARPVDPVGPVAPSHTRANPPAPAVAPVAPPDPVAPQPVTRRDERPLCGHQSTRCPLEPEPWYCHPWLAFVVVLAAIVIAAVVIVSSVTKGDRRAS